MPEDYKKVVLAYYEEKKNDGTLSPNLLDSTPGSIREQCILTYRKRCSTKDDEIIRLFFGNTNQECLALLEKSFAVKFRQLPKILKGDVDNPSIRYIELIAWLIDFEPRPSTKYYRSFYEEERTEISGQENTPIDSIVEIGAPKNMVYGSTDSTISGLIAEKDEENNRPIIPAGLVLDNSANAQEIKSDHNLIQSNADENLDANIGFTQNKAEKWFSIKKLIIISLFFVGVGAFLIRQNKTDRETITKEEKCMYWNGDSYVAIVCHLPANSLKIPLDTFVLRQQKRISQPDALTSNSIGNVWYGKKNGEIAFYTSAGNNPLDTNKRLLPVTDYILKKYTSYHRYQLTILVWCIVGFVILAVLTFIAFRLIRKRTS